MLSALLLLPAALAAAAAQDLPDPADLREDLVFALDTRRGLLRDRSDQRTLLSESASLLLELDLALGDKEAFDADAALLERYFLAPSGLLRWRLGRSDHGFCSNATVDDLRAARALLDAGARWNNPAHRALGTRIGQAVLAHATRDGVLVDAASWPCGRHAAPAAPTPGAYLTLSFADLGALARLAPSDPHAAAVLGRTRQVITAGLLDPASPRSGFDLPSGAWDLREDNPINRELLRLAVLDDVPDPALRAQVCAQRDETWRASGSVAHIALAARRIEGCGHPHEADQALAHMGTFLLDQGPWAGLFGYEIDGDTVVWAFDNLQAALTIVQIGASR